MSESNNNKKDALDEFWDIGRLIPPKPKMTKKTQQVSNLQLSTVVSGQIDNNFDSESIKENRLTVHKENGAPQPLLFAEHHNFSSLISRVTVLNWKSTYNYYEFFCRQAAALYHKHGTECEEAHFFSYVAQYSQMNRRQLDWYLWWRECARNGTYLGTDISYIYLLVFEIINLGDQIDTRVSLNLLISLWANYKDVYPQLNSALGDWICDYSLIHNLPIQFPDPRIGRELISSVSPAEVFFDFDIADARLLSQFILEFCCPYNYRKSKFYTPETQTLYEAHLPKALEHWINMVDLQKLLGSLPKKKISKVAFTGALCSYKARKHIEVEYVSILESTELRGRASDIVKYAENKIRAYVGIRSRLGTPTLDPKSKTEIDNYFTSALPISENNEGIHPDYERFYEIADNTFSLESALDIEKRSWEVTEKLVDAFDEEKDACPQTSAVSIIPTQAPIWTEFSEDESDTGAKEFLKTIKPHLNFFEAVLRNNYVKQREYIQAHHLLPEALVDEINEFAVEHFGDIVIEECDDGYSIIEDYRSLFEREE